MKERFSDLPSSFVCKNIKLVEQMDARQMKYENESFDVVLDKGLLDTILVNF
jgi:hypothetical protein